MGRGQGLGSWYKKVESLPEALMAVCLDDFTMRHDDALERPPKDIFYRIANRIRVADCRPDSGMRSKTVGATRIRRCLSGCVVKDQVADD
jgi:hypothetical protein